MKQIAERTFTEKRKTQKKGTAGRTPHQQLVKGLSHPIRVECLTLLAEQVASPRELAEALDEDLSNVSYHIRVLSELGLIELIREEPVRGAVAHFYKAVERPMVSAEDWEDMPLEVRKMFSVYNWDTLIKEASVAIEKGTFEKRDDWHMTRTSVVLDSQGFERLSKAMEELLELVFEEEAASARRRTESNEEPIYAVTGMALFEMPDPKQRRPAPDA